MLKLDEKPDINFELYTLLKSAVSIFTFENLPLSRSETLINYNFTQWIKIEFHIISKILDLIQKMLPEEKSNRLSFKQYINSKITTDYSKSKILEEILNQESLEDSLILLGTTFLHLKVLSDNISSIKNVNFQTFQSIGHFVRREVAFNKFFDPFEPPFFKPVTDKISSRQINEIIKTIPHSDTKKITSAIILEMFRILKYLSLTHEVKKQKNEIPKVLGIYTLVNSESRDLESFLHNEFISQSLKKDDGESTFYELLESTSFQLKLELKKVFKGELVGIVNETKYRKIIAKCENATGILDNFFKQAIESVVKFFEPGLNGEDLFEGYVSKKEISSKLLKNLLLLNKLTLYVKEKITKSAKEDDVKDSIKKFINYIDYFEKYVLCLFRLSDRDEIEKLLCSFKGINDDQIIKAHKGGFLQSLSLLLIFLETLIPMVRRRCELKEFEFSGDLLSQLDELLSENQS